MRILSAAKVKSKIRYPIGYIDSCGRVHDLEVEYDGDRTGDSLAVFIARATASMDVTGLLLADPAVVMGMLTSLQFDFFNYNVTEEYRLVHGIVERRHLRMGNFRDKCEHCEKKHVYVSKRGHRLW